MPRPFDLGKFRMKTETYFAAEVSAVLLYAVTHHVLYTEDTEVHVRTLVTNTRWSCRSTFSEWVGLHSVTGFEADTRLERVLVDGANHRQRHVWAVEHTSVVRV